MFSSYPLVPHNISNLSVNLLSSGSDRKFIGVSFADTPACLDILKRKSLIKLCMKEPVSFVSGCFVEELVLGGDVYFSGCCPHEC